MGMLNYIGVRNAARFMNLVTALKFGSLAGLALLGFTAGQGSWGHFTPAFSGGADDLAGRDRADRHHVDL